MMLFRQSMQELGKQSFGLERLVNQFKQEEQPETKALLEKHKLL